MTRQQKLYTLNLGQLKSTTANILVDVIGLRVTPIACYVSLSSFTGRPTDDEIILDVLPQLTLSTIQEIKEEFREPVMVQDHIEEWPNDVA